MEDQLVDRNVQLEAVGDSDESIACGFSSSTWIVDKSHYNFYLDDK